MNKIIVLSVVIFFLSCKSKSSAIEETSVKEEDFVNSYKISVLYGCLNEGSNGNFQKFIKESNDLGLAIQVAVLQHQETKEAENLGVRLSKDIVPIDYEDYDNKKPIFSTCAFHALSKEVDSKARASYKKKYNY